MCAAVAPLRASSSLLLSRPRGERAVGPLSSSRRWCLLPRAWFKYPSSVSRSRSPQCGLRAGRGGPHRTWSSSPRRPQCRRRAVGVLRATASARVARLPLSARRRPRASLGSLSPRDGARARRLAPSLAPRDGGFCPPRSSSSARETRRNATLCSARGLTEVRKWQRVSGVSVACGSCLSRTQERSCRAASRRGSERQRAAGGSAPVSQ